MTESPAETLRRAAKLMRERGEHATILNPPPWTVAIEGTPEVPWVKSSKGGIIAPAYLVEAEHIAGMHPGVALALADWLDAEAHGYDVRAFLTEACGYEFHKSTPTDDALKVARAYLGEVPA